MFFYDPGMVLDQHYSYNYDADVLKLFLVNHIAIRIAYTATYGVTTINSTLLTHVSAVWDWGKVIAKLPIFTVQPTFANYYEDHWVFVKTCVI